MILLCKAGADPAHQKAACKPFITTKRTKRTKDTKSLSP